MVMKLRVISGFKCFFHQCRLLAQRKQQIRTSQSNRSQQLVLMLHFSQVKYFSCFLKKMQLSLCITHTTESLANADKHSSFKQNTRVLVYGHTHLLEKSAKFLEFQKQTFIPTAALKKTGFHQETCLVLQIKTVIQGRTSPFHHNQNVRIYFELLYLMHSSVKQVHAWFGLNFPSIFWVASNTLLQT